MKKWTVAFVVATLLTGQAEALPVGAVESLFVKLFKRGVAEEAVVAARVAEGAAGAKSLEQIAGKDIVGHRSILLLVEPKPDMAAGVSAKTLEDAEAYEALRVSAGRSDPAAMLKMSEMTASGKVSDAGEPWHGYWTFQTARLGSQAAVRKFRDECSAEEDRRASDRWFDSACGSADKRNLYIGYQQPGAYSPYRPNFLMRPVSQSGPGQ